jgi:undecaprenyl-diphosphatase
MSHTATWLAAGAATLWFGMFLKVSRELLNASGVGVVALDRAATRIVVGARQPWLTHTAIDVTALGSPIVLGIIVAVAAVGLRLTRDRLGAFLLASSTAGAIGWTWVLKNLIERERPPISMRLVGTSGFSFPSGHSLASACILAALAVILCRHLPRRVQHLLAFVVTGAIIAAVAASRVYLGVHYFSDVLAGTSFGLAWAFGSVASLSALEKRRARRIAHLAVGEP